MKEGKYHETTATKTIEEGEEILISYNLCEECHGRRHWYGTAGTTKIHFLFLEIIYIMVF
jgi:hypothetical protein